MTSVHDVTYDLSRRHGVTPSTAILLVRGSTDAVQHRKVALPGPSQTELS